MLRASLFALAFLFAAVSTAMNGATRESRSAKDQASGQIWLGLRRSDFVGTPASSLPEQSWNKVAPRLSAVIVPEHFIRGSPDKMLVSLIQDLDRRHIDLALEILPINWFHEVPCGGGVEGYSDPGSAYQVVTKLKRAGANVRFISMDEPLWFGHYYSGKNACRSSLDNLAERTSVLVKIYTAAFPGVVVGETEPFPALSSQPNWPAEYFAWLQAFRKAAGVRSEFLQMDVDWGDPKMNIGSASDGSDIRAVAALVRNVSAVARRNRLKVGMIYWGGGSNDAQWMQRARLHVREVQNAGVSLDEATFVTWNPYPSHTFPETDPNALSSLIQYYLRLREKV
jgi:hypothetical protein